MNFSPFKEDIIPLTELKDLLENSPVIDNTDGEIITVETIGTIVIGVDDCYYKKFDKGDFRLIYKGKI